MRQEPIGDDLLPAPLNAVMPRSGQAQAALFWRPQYVRNNTILWQIPFLFWLLEITRPRRYVEIGVGEGVAYMAACQSLHRLQIDAQCYAVGVWKAVGDDMEVPPQFASRNADLYDHFSRILTEGVEKSHRHFDAGSIDLMVVDLSSIAEAGMPPPAIIETLREKWLPKLSEQCILLLHGMGEDESTLAFIDDLSGRMPALRLPGGDGAIALLYGNQPAERIANIASLPADHHIRRTLVEMFDRLGAASYYEMSSRASEDRVHFTERDLEELRKKYDDLARRLEESQVRYEQRHRQVANLQAKSFDMEMAKEAQRAEIDRLSQELNGLRVERNQLAKLSGEREALAVEIADLKMSVEQKDAEIDRLVAERGVARQECRQWASQLEIERKAHVQVREEHETALEEAMEVRKAMEAASGKEFALHLQGTKLLIQALEQSESVVQALTLELRYVQDQLGAARENETALMELALEDRRTSPLQRFTAWTATAQSGRG